MQASQTPTLVPLAFAANGTKNAIPEASQIGVTPGAASLNDGFPPLTFTPIAAGGVPPAGADFNGVLNLITQSIRWQHGGGHYGYNSTFANDANVGGYPRGAVLMSANQSGLWLNSTDGNTTNPDTGGAGWAPLVSGVVGATRNLSMSVTAASATATLTADEIIVETALGGLRYCLPSFSKTINLATTGAGGMDTGSTPVSGFVALYAIYNPTTQTSALLATNATSAVAPNVYGGANMPTGYTASALVSVWGTNGSGQFVIAYQSDRVVNIQIVSALTATALQSTFTALSISTIVPRNARGVTGGMGMTNGTTGNNNSLAVAGSASSTGQKVIGANFTANPGGVACAMDRVPLITPQTLYYSITGTGGTITAAIQISGYDF